ncbi:MAG: ArsR/SmtB family transcription factor [Actinomycetes bacterium]
MGAAEAISDPVRRAILELLSTGERSAGTIAAEFDISRPAVSRHLRVLREGGVVAARADGRQQVYTLVRPPLEELASWLVRLCATEDAVTTDRWDARLDALETEVRRTRRTRRRAAGRTTEETA